MKYAKSGAKAAAKTAFRGLVAATTTPFLPNGELDEAGIRSNMRMLTDVLKVDGVFCGGVMGEFWALTKEERKRVTEITVEEATGKCLVIAHTGHHCADEAIELTRHAEGVGADYAILINPYYPPSTPDMMVNWFEYVCERVNIGVWLFDALYSGVTLTPPVIARLAEIENVCGIKVPRPHDYFAEVHRLVGDKIVVSHPNEGDFLPFVKEFGIQVHQSSAMPFLYQTAHQQLFRDYSELALEGKFDEAAPIAAKLKPLRELNEKWIRRPWNEHQTIAVANIKAWSEFLGMAAGPVRAPMLQISPAAREELHRDLEATGLLQQRPLAA
ncbi:dihydrodipicolinate synthase family protein [Microvirga zambiensis]|uniref:dihydrodipicolinate synthase family protein n=1 Tax=Microvirga zambiensis TaxID=1402137 RepID=UPI00191DD481|nr:dihydrodipicolinate synthase family protein [Microvirga zambiensis]